METNNQNNTNTTVSKEEKVAALVGTLIFFVPCFMKTKTEFVTFYMKQSFALLLLNLVFSIIFGILTSILFIFAYVSMAISVGFLVAIVFLAIKAYKGVKLEIPHLYKHTDDLVSKVSFLKKLFAPR